MTTLQAASAFKVGFLKRTIRAREYADLSQAELGKLLGGMAQNKYEKYENRSLLPHALIETFCLATGVRVEWLVTGKGEMARAPVRVVASR